MLIQKVSRPARWQKQLRRVLASWQLYALLIPTILYLVLFNYVPIYGVQIAFRDFRGSQGIWGSKWVGLKHFARFIQYPNFWPILRNTLVISLYSLSTFPCSVILALLFNELDNRYFKRTVQMAAYAPHFISMVVVCSMLTLFLNRNGLINNLLALVGVQRTDYLTYPEYFASIYVWSGVWQSVGFGTVIYMAALSSVPGELIEAAYIDGASRLRIVWHINIPTILPTIVTMLILRCGSILNVGFEKVLLLQNALNLEASQVVSTYVYDLGIQKAQYSYSSAIGLMNTVVNVLMLMIVNQISRKITKVGLW